jgi:hypothetical protein
MTSILAVILLIDIVKYTSEMDWDDIEFLQLLKADRGIIQILIYQNNGQLFKEIRGGNLANFPSITEAILCSGSIQKEVHSFEMFQNASD